MPETVYDLQFKWRIRRRWRKHKCGFKVNGDPFIWFEKDKMYIKFSDHKVCQHVCYCPICGKKIGRRYDTISASWNLWETRR